MTSRKGGMSSVVRLSALLLMLVSCAHVEIEEKLRSEYSVDFWNRSVMERRHDGKVLWRANIDRPDIDKEDCGWKDGDEPIRSVSSMDDRYVKVRTRRGCSLYVAQSDGKVTCGGCVITCPPGRPD